jgi:hypothetical protein
MFVEFYLSVSISRVFIKGLISVGAAKGKEVEEWIV